MPTWSTEPPPVPQHMGFKLRRTPPDAPLTAIVTSPDLIGCNTHYWGGRTYPCEMPDCKACNASIPFRWHAYLSAYDDHTHEHFLFECTAHAALAFRDYRAAQGTLRGCFFQALRPKRGKNGRIEIITKPADLTRCTLPQPPDLVRAISVIWQLPSLALPTSTGLDGAKQIRANARTIARMKGDRTDVPEPQTIGDVLAGNGEKISDRAQAPPPQ